MNELIDPDKMWESFFASSGFTFADDQQVKFAKMIFLSGAWSMLNRLPQVLATALNQEETYVKSQSMFRSKLLEVSNG